jgi:hypothetical protein
VTQRKTPVPSDELDPQVTGEDIRAGEDHPQPPKIGGSLAPERGLAYPRSWLSLGWAEHSAYQTAGGEPISPRFGPTKPAALGVGSTWGRAVLAGGTKTNLSTSRRYDKPCHL